MSKKDYDLKYQKANIKRVYLTLNKEHDKDIIALLEQQKNVNGFLKELLREHIKEKKNESSISD